MRTVPISRALASPFRLRRNSSLGYQALANAVASLRKTVESRRRRRCRPDPNPGDELRRMMRKGQVRWLAKGDVVGQAGFIDPTSSSPPSTE
jgi:hypothetical protein